MLMVISDAILKLVVVAGATMTAAHPWKRLFFQTMVTYVAVGAEFEVPMTSNHHQFGL